MLHIIMYQPEIPPNTGNIIRLCANTGASLHLIRPIGFSLDDKRLLRAGLDYHEFSNIKLYDDLVEVKENIEINNLYAISTKGKVFYNEAIFKKNDALLFGSETRGLPDSIRNSLDYKNILRIPMKGDSRSINLSNAVSIVTYEAWRQLRYIGGN